MKMFAMLGLVGLAAGPAMAAERVVTIVNRTSYDIVDLYVANRDDPKWGGSFLQDTVLKPNYEVDIDIDDGSGYCVFDLLAVYEDGVQVRKNGINACALDVFYFTQ